MKRKLRLKQIEELCQNNEIKAYDLILLGLEIQRKEIDTQCLEVDQLCRSFKKDSREKAKNSHCVREIASIRKANWN